MPVYKVKPESDSYPAEVSTAKNGKPKKRYPTVTIPVSKEIIAALKVDGKVTVEITGIVQKLQSSEASGGDSYDNRTEMRVELRVVEAYPGDDAEEDADEDKEESMQDAIDKGLGYAKDKET